MQKQPSTKIKKNKNKAQVKLRGIQKQEGSNKANFMQCLFQKKLILAASIAAARVAIP